MALDRVNADLLDHVVRVVSSVVVLLVVMVTTRHHVTVTVGCQRLVVRDVAGADTVLTAGATHGARAKPVRKRTIS